MSKVMSYLLLIANRNMAGAPSANQCSGPAGNSAQASVCNTVIPHYLCWSSEHSLHWKCLQAPINTHAVLCFRSSANPTFNYVQRFQLIATNPSDVRVYIKRKVQILYEQLPYAVESTYGFPHLADAISFQDIGSSFFLSYVQFDSQWQLWQIDVFTTFIYQY